MGLININYINNNSLSKLSNENRSYSIEAGFFKKLFGKAKKHVSVKTERKPNSISFSLSLNLGKSKKVEKPSLPKPASKPETKKRSMFWGFGRKAAKVVKPEPTKPITPPAPKKKGGFFSNIGKKAFNFGKGVLNVGKKAGKGVLNLGKKIGTGVLNAGKKTGKGFSKVGNKVSYLGKRILNAGRKITKKI